MKACPSSASGSFLAMDREWECPRSGCRHTKSVDGRDRFEYVAWIAAELPDGANGSPKMGRPVGYPSIEGSEGEGHVESWIGRETIL